MKKFSISIFFFLCLFVIVDFLLGIGLDYFASHAKTGQAYKNYEIAETAAPDILILGSSRAVHHYVPEKFEDSFGLSTYVAGQDGNGIILMNPIMHHISERHKPKIIIYDITPIFDLYDDDPHTYLRYLRLLKGKSAYADSLIHAIDPTETLKLHSRLFQYNSAPLSLVKCFFKKSKEFDHGYKPFFGSLNINTVPQLETSTHPVSDLKLKLFKDMIKYCHDNNIKLYFTISPSYNTAANATYTERDSALSSMIDDLGITVLDYSNNPTFANPKYFKDNDHLNNIGSEVFTDSIIGRLK